jgi:penicillin-binding protein-related factor A (putative recombinase)
MKKAPALLEKDIEKSILQYLEFIPGCYAWKNHTGGYFDIKAKTFKKQRNKYAINGVSDIIGVYNGRFLAIEVKRPSNKTRTPEQDQFINTVIKNGGIAFYAMSIEDVKKELGI